MQRRWGINSSLIHRAKTMSDTSVENIVATVLIPMIERYNEYGGLDWRLLLCEDDDEQMREFVLPDASRFAEVGFHSTPRFTAENMGTYQEGISRYGMAFGFDAKFEQYNTTSEEWAKRVKQIIQQDLRTIRFEILKECFNPTSLGRGFYNQTYDALGVLTAPPVWGTNTFAATHTHYATTGAATLANFDVFDDMKQHIREHGDVSGFVGFMNSTDLTAIEKLGSPIGTGRVNIPSFFTDSLYKNGLVDEEFDYKGIRWIKNEWIPSGYIVMIALAGDTKAFKFHQPNNEAYRGMLWAPGPNGSYPWQDSVAFRQFRVRAFNRWMGAVYQISANANYTVPSYYA